MNTTTNATEEVWNEADNNILMTSCFRANYSATNSMIEASDCVNGSTLANKTLLGELSNFTYLSNLHFFKADLDRTIAPLDSDLIISNESRLMINLEGCVNTLRDECRDFFRVYAKDGSDHNARARFPCFYSPSDTSFAVQVS